jgi:hypothetical protein
MTTDQVTPEAALTTDQVAAIAPAPVETAPVEAPVAETPVVEAAPVAETPVEAPAPVVEAAPVELSDNAQKVVNWLKEMLDKAPHHHQQTFHSFLMGQLDHLERHLKG